MNENRVSLTNEQIGIILSCLSGHDFSRFKQDSLVDLIDKLDRASTFALPEDLEEICRGREAA